MEEKFSKVPWSALPPSLPPSFYPSQRGHLSIHSKDILSSCVLKCLLSTRAVRLGDFRSGFTFACSSRHHNHHHFPALLRIDCVVFASSAPSSRPHPRKVWETGRDDIEKEYWAFDRRMRRMAQPLGYALKRQSQFGLIEEPGELNKLGR